MAISALAINAIKDTLDTDLPDSKYRFLVGALELAAKEEIRCCDHEMWEHEFVDESYDSLIFGKCEVEDCECEGYSEPL